MKLTKHAWMLWGIALAAVLIVSFAIPFAHTAVYWIALIGMLVFFGLIAGAFYRSFRRGEDLTSKLLGWPIFKTACISLILQIVIGFILMGFSNVCPVWAAVIVELLMLGFSAAVLVVRDAAREAVVGFEQKMPDRTQAIKELRLQATGLAAVISDPEAKAEMQKLADELKYADPVSSDATKEAERILSDMLMQVKEEKDPKKQQEMIGEARIVLGQRNSAAKRGK